MEKIFSFLGKVIVGVVILVCLSLVAPRFIGMQAYNVISGSMEPTISVGSIVYVKTADFKELSKGDIIAFDSGASVVTHRIVSIDESDKLITTKGDANDANDFMPVAYVNVIGKITAHLPLLGYVAAAISTTLGKIITGVIFIVGVILSGAGGSKKRKVETRKHEDESPTNKKKTNPKIVLAIGLVIVFGALGGFLYIYMDYNGSNELYDDLNDSYVETEKEVPWYEMVQVDFEDLKKINPDVIGWIYVENTDISYPIMYSGNDSTYLRTTIEKQPATAGSIFLEGLNRPDFSDSHDIIYGHNMRNLSMFGTLKFYKSEPNYLEEHKYFQILTPEKKMRFEIFTYFDTDAASWVYTLPYSDNKDFEDFIGKLKSNAYKDIKTEKEVHSSDKVTTLSTCSTTGRRFTLHGYLCDER